MKNKGISLGIITYNRPKVLMTMLEGLMNCYNELDYIVISDDGSSDTVKEIMHDFLLAPKEDNIIYLNNEKNIGVAGNSNRVIKKLYDLGCEQMIIANDDLIVKAGAVNLYKEASIKTGIGLFCFRKWTGSVNDRVEKIRIDDCRLTSMIRVTGHWMFIHRSIVDKIGYFDTGYGKFGQEHVDYVYRAIYSGAANYPSMFLKGGILDMEDSVNFLDIQEVSPAISNTNDWAYWDTFASAYHQKKWKEKSGVNMYELYQE